MPTPIRFTLPDPDTLSPLRALHSLREKHVQTLARTLSQLPGIWSLERQEGYDGDLTVMLMPQRPEGESFIISRKADGFHLGASQEDDYRELGCFAGIDELVAVMHANLTRTMRCARAAATRI